MKRYPGLDLLRAMAIIWVMLFPLLVLLVLLLLRRPSWKVSVAVCGAVLTGGLALRAHAWSHGLEGGLVLRTQPWRFVGLIVHTYAPSLVPPGTVQAFAVYAVAAILGGTLLYFCVERPFLLLRERVERLPVPSPAVPAVALTE